MVVTTPCYSKQSPLLLVSNTEKWHLLEKVRLVTLLQRLSRLLLDHYVHINSDYHINKERLAPGPILSDIHGHPLSVG